MDVLRPLRAFDGYQQGHRWLAIPVAVVKKYSDDGAGSLAGLIAYYAFFSIFPLLLVLVTVLGFVLQGDPSAQKSAESSVLGHFPVIGDQIQTETLQGHTLAIVVGVVGSLWAGLGVTQAAQNAFAQVWAVPRTERPNFLGARLRGLALVMMLGIVFVVSSVASGLVAGGLGGSALRIAGIVFSLLLNLVLFTAAFRFLTPWDVPNSDLWAGAIFGSVLWEILQLAGGVYVEHVINKASNTYGTFATVLGLLVWLQLGATMTLYAAELNVVVARRLWPRSLLGPEIPADEKTLAALARVEQRSDRERIDVHFED